MQINAKKYIILGAVHYDYYLGSQMLVTGITQNATESIGAVTLLDGAVVGPTSNIPWSPMA